VFTYRAWGSLDGMGTTPLHLGVSRNRLECYSTGVDPMSRLWTVSGWDRTVFGVAPTGRVGATPRLVRQLVGMRTESIR
jgi:hypothetical protein